MLDGQYETVSDAARELGVTTQRVHQLIKSGQLTAEQVHARLKVIPRNALDAFKKITRPHGLHIDKRPDPKPLRRGRRRAS